MRRSVFALAGILLAGGIAGHANVISDSSANDDGWRSVTLAFPDPGAPPAILQTFVPTWSSSGGNPGAYIFNSDPNGNTQYWLAPSKFLGDQSAAYSNSLQFSLADSPVGTIFSQADIILTGGGLTLTLQLGSVPNANWNSYSVALIAGSWTVNSPSGAVASTAQLQTTLASLSGLYIRGEYYLSNDFQSLDSVTLQQTASATPEPGTIMAAFFGLGMAIAARRFRSARRQ
jgi:hypothetical protein